MPKTGKSVGNRKKKYNSKKEQNEHQEDEKMAEESFDQQDIENNSEAEEDEHMDQQNELNNKDDELTSRVFEFKVVFPDKLDSFEDFIGVMMPTLCEIEECIASDFTSLPGKEKFSSSYKQDSLQHKQNTAIENSNLFHVYGALLTEALVPEITHDSASFRIQGMKSGEQVLGDILAIVNKMKAKTLENKRLKLNIEKNDSLSTSPEFDEEVIKPILLELIQRYDSSVESAGVVGTRRNYFQTIKPKEEPRQKRATRSRSRSQSPLLAPANSKTQMMLEDLRSHYDPSAKFDLDTHKPQKLEGKHKAVFGGSFGICELTKEQKASQNMMDIEDPDTSELEKELRARLLEEFNNPDSYHDKNPLRFMESILQSEMLVDISVYTVLLTAVVYIRRVTKTKGEMTAQETVEDLLRLPKYIPFPLSFCLKDLQLRMIIAKALDLLLEPEVENCAPQSAYQYEVGKFKDETNAKNAASEKLCPYLCRLYHHENCMVSTQVLNKLEVYKKQLDILVNTYKYFAEEAKTPEIRTPMTKLAKTPISKIDALYSDAKKVTGIEGYQELTLLKLKLDSARKEDEEIKSGERMEEENPKETEEAGYPVIQGRPEDSQICEEPVYNEVPRLINMNLNDQMEEEAIKNPFDSEPQMQNLPDEISKNTSPKKNLSPIKSPASIHEEQTPFEGMYRPKETTSQNDQPDMHDEEHLPNLEDKAAELEVETTPHKTDEEHLPNLEDKAAELEVETTPHKTSAPQEMVEEQPQKDQRERIEPWLQKEQTHSHFSQIMNSEEKRKTHEDQLTKKLGLLRTKLSYPEAMRRLEELRSDPQANQNELNSLEANIKLSEDWTFRYHEAMKSGSCSVSRIRDLIDDLDEIVVRMDEMELFIEMYIQHRAWKSKLNNALRIIKKPRKSTTQGMDIEENAEDRAQELAEMLTFQDLQEIIDEASNLRLDDFEDSRLKDLVNRFAQAKQLEGSISENLENIFDINVLVNYENDIRSLKVKLPQLEIIQSRIQANQEVLDLLSRTVTLEQMERLLETPAEDLKEVHSEYYSQLTKKYEDTKELLQTARNLVLPEQSVVEYDHLCQIRKVLQRAEDLKVSFDEDKELKGILKSFAWVFKIYCMMDEDILKAANYEETLLLKLDMPLPQFNIDDIVNACRTYLEDKTSHEKRFAWLKLAVDAGENLRMVDARIEKLYSDCSLNLWRCESVNFLGKKRSSRELERLLNDAPEFVLSKLDEGTLQFLHEELVKIKEWKTLYEGTVDAQIEAFIRLKIEKELKDPARQEKVFDLKARLIKLSTEFTPDLAKYPDLEHCYGSVQKYLNWVTWAMTVGNISSELDQGGKISSFKELKDLYTAASTYAIPKSMEFYKKVEKWYNLASETLKGYRAKFESLKPSPDPEALLSTIEKESVRKSIEKHKSRPTLGDTIKMKNSLESQTSFVSFADEIDRLNQMQEKYQKWQLNLETFITSDGQRILESIKEKEHVIEDYEQIGKAINHLKAEFICLELHNEEDENKLASMEWQYRTYLLMKHLNKKAGLGEWKKLSHYSDEDPEIDLSSGKQLTKFLQGEMHVCKKFHKLVKSLTQTHKPGEIRSLEEVEKLYARYHKCLIKLPDDEKIIDDLLARVKKLAARANELATREEKESMVEFTKTLDQIKHLPISLNAEVELLESHINNANKLVSTIRKNNSMDLGTVEKLLKEYKACPIVVTEAHKLQESYEKARNFYQKIQSDLQKMAANSATLTFEEITDISQKIDDIKWDYDGQLCRTKVQAYNLKVGYIRKQKTGKLETTAENTISITYHKLKSFVKEGRNLKTDVIDSKTLDENVFWMDNILRQSEEKINELKKVSSVEALDRLPSLIFNFLDISQEIIERRAEIISGDSQVQPKKQKDENLKHSQEPYDPDNIFENDKSQKAFKDRTNDEMGGFLSRGGSKFPNPLTNLEELLEKNENLHLNAKGAKILAVTIANNFPVVKDSSDRLGRLVTMLKNVISYPNIAKYLLDNNFEKKEVAVLLKQTDNALVLADRKLAEIGPKKRVRNYLQREEQEGEPKKRVRTGSSIVNLVDFFNELESKPHLLKGVKSGKETKVTSKEMEVITEKYLDNKQSKEIDKRRKKPAMPSRQDTFAKASGDYSEGELQYTNTLPSNLSMREQKSLANKKNKSTPYDPDSVDVNPPKDLAKKPKETTSTAPPGTVFKVFDGLLKIMDRTSPKVGMYTCASMDVIKQIPLILDDRSSLLKVQGKMSTQRFEGYMDEFMGIFDTKNHYVIAGWVEAESSSQQDSCDQIAQEFLRESSIGMIRYLDCAKLFFIHKNQMPFEWTRKLDFKIRKVRPSAFPPSLAFILIYQPAKSTADVTKLRKINPQIQTPFQELLSSTQSAYQSQRSSGASIEPSRAGGFMKKQQTPEFQRTQQIGFGGKSQQINTKAEFSTVYLERPNSMKEANTSRSYQNGQKSPKPYQNGQKSPKPYQNNSHNNTKALFSRNQMETEYELLYDPQSMYEEDINVKEEPQDYFRKPHSREDSWKTQNYENLMSQRTGPKSFAAANNKVYNQMSDEEINSRNWPQPRGQQNDRWSNSQKLNSSLERTSNYPTYSQNVQKTERMTLSPFSKSDNRKLSASPMNHSSSRQIKSPKLSYNSMGYDEPNSHYNSQHPSNAPFAKQITSKDLFSQSQTNLYSSQRGASRSTWDQIEEEDGFMSKTQRMHSQAYPKYESSRNSFSQKSNLQGSDLINVPLKNLDSSPTANDLRAFQNRHITQSKGSSFDQVNSMMNYPSYKPNNYKSNLKW